MRQMGNKNNLTSLQKQTIQPSLAMQESLKVLQMGCEELKIWLEEKITQNPLIDWDEDEESTYVQESSFSQGIGDPENQIPHEISCFEYLMNQAHQVFIESHLPIAEWIIGNLDNTGFYTLLEEELPSTFAIKDFHFCLEKIKQFDPPGIGAANIQESLLLQLKAQGKESSLSSRIIQDHWADLIQKKWIAIQKKTGTTSHEIAKTVQVDIAPLNPFPGYRFHKKMTSMLSIDIYLLQEKETLQIHIRDSFKLKENQNSLLSKEYFSKEEHMVFKTYQKEAKWLINSLEKRKKTLRKVTEYLVTKQMDYLQGNCEALKPVKIKEASLEIGLHESTITRAIENKNLSCSLGIIPLKTLFAKSLHTDISSDQAKKLLSKLVMEENKNAPLSDRELLEKMQVMGIPCARRTITKYRNSLHIPSQSKRKQRELI